MFDLLSPLYIFLSPPVSPGAGTGQEVGHEAVSGHSQESYVVENDNSAAQYQRHSDLSSIMGVPEAVLAKVGSLPDVASMSKDDLSALCKQLYERSCVVFGEKFDEEYQVRKRDMEIHNLEMETSESHGTFKIPKLKKVNKFKMMGDEEAAEGK